MTLLCLSHSQNKCKLLYRKHCSVRWKMCQSLIMFDPEVRLHFRRKLIFNKCFSDETKNLKEERKSLKGEARLSKGPYLCSQCGDSFDDKVPFRKHQIEKHNVVVWYGKTLSPKQTRRSTRSLKTGDLPKKENIKTEKFSKRKSSPDNLTRDLFQKFKINPCSVQIDNLKYVYKRHEIKKKSKTSEYKKKFDKTDCEKCGRTFPDRESLIRHKRFLCGFSLHSCRYCRFKTNREDILYAHMNSTHLKFEKDFFKTIIKIKDEDN